MPFPAIGSYGPYADWDETATYAEGDVVYFGGYLYRAMMAISAGDNPRTATASFAFTDDAGINSSGMSPPYSATEYRTMRKWRIFDLPNSYYQAMLRGIPADRFGTTTNTSPLIDEIRTTCISGFDVRAAPKVTSCSYSGYGISAGLDSTWDDPIYGELLYSFSAIPLDELENTTYVGPTTNFTAIFWQPDTIAATINTGDNGGFPEDYLLPAWSSETQGQMFSCIQTFSRTFDYILDGSTGTSDASDTPAFQDNWEAQRNWIGYYGALGISGTNPDYP